MQARTNLGCVNKASAGWMLCERDDGNVSGVHEYKAG